jgi:prephenate dehydratase
MEVNQVSNLLVAFQGERGAYSEEAAIKYCAYADLLPCRTFQEVFHSVASKRAYAGLIPIENSLAGSINESYDLLYKYDPGISGEVIIPVNHCLMALPGQNLHDIKRVYSHPQALAQCDAFIVEHKFEAVAVYDTAGSAKMLRTDNLMGCASIASRRSADLYSLSILAENIQTVSNNYTRFYVIGGKTPPPTEHNKTVLIISVKHTPGSLFWALASLVSRGINLTKLESRPCRTNPWEYLFYLDLETHIFDPKCQAALAELKTKTTLMKVLGSFPKAEG